MTPISNDKACWSCLKKTMKKCPELGVGWYKCSKCGVTYIDMPKLAPQVLGGRWIDVEGNLHRHPNPAYKTKKSKV
jgi:hypothetical protein